MPHSAERTLVLSPERHELNYWRDLWSYRELFLILAWRDFSVRYKQTVVGVAWALVRPVLTMLVFVVIFGRLAKLPSDGDAPYALMVLAGMLPWFLFSSILSDASTSLVTNANLIGKVYFPRIIVPSAVVVVALVDFLITFAVLAVMMAWMGVLPGPRVLLLPVFLALAIAASLGPSLLMAALNVQYRDFRYVIPFALQFGLYVSPVGYSSAVVPEKWRLLFSLNPVVPVIDGFRWCLLGGGAPFYWPGFLAGTAVTALLLWLGISYFRRTERSFADVL